MIFVCEHHDAVLHDWRRRGLTNLAICHVDFHDDLRGLCIDRRRGTAYAIGPLARGEAPLDAGNFLAHAVLERRVCRLRWVHGDPGGRAWDWGIVRYESDRIGRSGRRRERRRAEEIPLAFDEIPLEEWSGALPGEALSIDWDCFASILQDAGGIEGRVAAFFDRLGSVVPRDSWVACSPEYSQGGLEPFHRFVERLAARFDQPLEWLDPDLREGKLHPSGVEARLPRDLASQLVLFLRRRGLY